MSENSANFSAMIDVVCGVIENSEGQFLACQRPAGKHLGGLWEFPGGKVDPGESPESALVRELQEERSSFLTREVFAFLVRLNSST